MAFRLWVLAIIIAVAAPVRAAEISVAVAANFAVPAERIAAAFEARTGDHVRLSFGATGTLFAQISQGAPFQVFLSADMARPERAVADGLGVAGTQFTYAVGRLALYGPGKDLSDGLLSLGRVNGHVAIADPQTAPYGAAALEALQRTGLLETVSRRLVTGENVTQALQFVETGNAGLGFVALSQVRDRPAASVFEVPVSLYAPIRQGAVLLAAGKDNAPARAFLDFLKGAEASAIIRAEGYEAGS